MQIDFHYYATYCASYIAGYSHEDCLKIAYSAQMVDCCSVSFLSGIGGPKAAASTQKVVELADTYTDQVGLQDITRIWAAFHFLPYDLNADVKGGKRYKEKFRLICRPNGALLKDTVELAKGKDTLAAGVAMHVLADTWAHSYFAGTPSLVINNINYYVYEIQKGAEGDTENRIIFSHVEKDNIEKSRYMSGVFSSDENSIMNLGHGRLGHLPDFSFMRYRYLPAWGDYEEIVKDNPSDYYHAFCQMIYALKYLRGDTDVFETGKYDFEAAAPYETEIREIFEKRQAVASEDWKAFAEKLSGKTIPDFDDGEWKQEYMDAAAENKNDTVLGRFILAVLAQKSMVTNRIYKSGSRLAGISIDYNGKKTRGIRDFRILFDILGKKGGTEK